MDSDNEHLPRRSISAEAPLPTPSDTPYQTPRLSGLRLSSFGTPAAFSPLTPPPLPPDYSLKSNGFANGDKEPDYGVDQFTSNLQASLVAEVLSVRRELDSKNGLVDDLEAQLASTKTENETLQNNLKRAGKESRALKRELQLHEDGTLSVVDSLVRERDEINSSNNDLRRKIDSSQKRYKTQGEDMRRLKTALDEERSQWNNERRVLERKASLAQSRLQSLVEELDAREAVALEAENAASATAAAARVVEEKEPDDASSVYSGDSKLGRHLRFKESLGSIRELQQSLAAELEANEADEDQANQTDASEPETSDHEAPPPEAQEKRLSQTKVLGIVSAFEGLSDKKRDSTGSRDLQRTPSMQRQDSVKELSPEGAIDEPASATLRGEEVSESAPKDNARGTPPEEDKPTPTAEVEANQRRKRDPPPSRPKYHHSRAKSDPSPLWKARHDAAQEAVATPTTPKTSVDPSKNSEPLSKPAPVNVASAATQTEPLENMLQTTPAKEHETQEPELPPPPPPSRPAPPVPNPVPIIAIHPPETAPASPGKTVLPPGTKNAGCQTAADSLPGTRFAAVQTEAIRIDKRPVKLPPHLLPSALQSKTSSYWDPPSIRPKPEAKAKGHGTDHQDRTLPPPLPPLEEFSGPLNGDKETNHASSHRLKKIAPQVPLRTTSQAGADLDLEEELEDLELSDVEDSTMSLGRSSHRLPKQGRPSFEPPEPVPENDKFVLGPSKANKSRRSLESRTSQDRSKRASRLPGQNESVSQSQSRLASQSRHSGSVRSRSPSFGSAASSSNFSKSSGPKPPFAIPTRRSSKDAHNRDARGESGRSSPTRRSGRLAKKAGSIRKARSAAAVTDAGRPSMSDGKAFAAPFSFESVPEYPQRAALPIAGTKTRRFKRDSPSLNAQLQDINSLFPTGNASVGSSVQHTVVDAVTATMIGEWMWKYVRKRKSFGVTETVAEPGKTSDSRHKRWVWLSPYEKTIMWSNKQPTSNTALMGKTGRKLSIQSVLDVKDDTAPPKGAAGLIFNRSVLVLTPARALKFTAGSRERHYMWLTALSFLSQQTSAGNPRLSTFLPPPAPPVASVPESESSGRRSRASSFLRNTKKSVSQQSSGHATPTAQQHEANALRQPPNPRIPDSAFAPAVPRVPHRRKRSATGPSSGRPSLRGHPGTVASSNNSLLSAGNSSARLQSQSRASSARSFRAPEPDYERRMPVPEVSPRLTEESSDRQSLASAEFGGNNNFFDAVGVMRMDAFMKPGMDGAPRPDVAPTGPFRNFAAPAGPAGPAGHDRGTGSGDSFYGPPDISRHRPFIRRLGGSSLKSQEK